MSECVSQLHCYCYLLNHIGKRQFQRAGMLACQAVMGDDAAFVTCVKHLDLPASWESKPEGKTSDALKSVEDTSDIGEPVTAQPGSPFPTDQFNETFCKSTVLEVNAAFHESQTALAALEPDELKFNVKQVHGIATSAMETIKVVKPMLG